MNKKLCISFDELSPFLNSVEKPGRYVGGEFGAITDTPKEDDFLVCIVFPDLYEIGMSNQAVRILYKLFNDTEGIHAERAFSLAPDFQKTLEQNNIPVYSLENGIPIASFDLLAVTIGYELSFSNLLSFLNAGAIPLRSTERNDDHPLVIGGGPALTNPVPWGEFLDAVYIGEAEGKVAHDLKILHVMKKNGAGRGALLEKISQLQGYWTPGKPLTRRVSWSHFGEETGSPAVFPIPSMIPIQDHGVIEIMRGCPNKCRFCHAGVLYRPVRQKRFSRILEEANFLVNQCGYRNITLSSLSTGDYVGLEPLVSHLNYLYSDKKISFSLPSLRVNSITLSLLGNLGSIRKSGLTFAVETPTLRGQKGINKEVPAERVIEILQQARKDGWKQAKFYFMLGLPVENGDDEAVAIVEYLLDIQKATGINLNVNLGTFIPKPHTVFQRASQLTDEESIVIIRKIRNGVKANKRIRISFHSPYISFLEGIISRGDQRSGELAYQAWREGARFDAWDDLMDRDAWRKAISEADWDVETETCRERLPDEKLPWNHISLGTSDRHLLHETDRACTGVLTGPCAVVCHEHCGVCGKDETVVIPEQDIAMLEKDLLQEDNPCIWRRLLLSFRKHGPAIYLGHLDVMNVFERALQRTGYTVSFTRGFNPRPKIEFAQPLSLGIKSEREICTVQMEYIPDSMEDIRGKLNHSLPSGFDVSEISWIAPTPEGEKTRKVMGAFWGSDWLLEIPDTVISAEKLLASLSLELENREVQDDFRLELREGNLFIRLHHGGSKNHNLIRVLTAALGIHPLQAGLNIIRLETWASDKNDSPVRYETIFPS